MEISWLQTFLVAAEEGNFHRTAERLHLAQPTVTLHIQKLESTWGVALFDRFGRGVQLSRAGRRFLHHAKTLLDDYYLSFEDMMRWRQGYETTLKIIASPVVATTWLPRWIRGFSELEHNVEFSIQVVDSEYILPAVLQQEADLGLSRLQVAHTQVTCTRLHGDPVIMVAPRDEYDFEGPPRTIPDLLQQYPLFTHHHPEYWAELLDNLRGVFPGIRTIQVNQGYVALEWVSEKLGVSFFSKSIARRALLRGNVEEVPFSFFSLPTTSTFLIMPVHPTGVAEKFRLYINQHSERYL